MENKEFKPRFEMEAADLAVLATYPVKLVKQKSKRGSIYYQCRLMLSQQKVLTKPIDSRKFNIALLEKGISLNSNELLIGKCPVRFNKGMGSNNQVYTQYEVFISDSVRLAFFLDRDDLKEIELLIKNDYAEAITFVERPGLDELDTDEVALDF